MGFRGADPNLSGFLPVSWHRAGMAETNQKELFTKEGERSGSVFINARCQLRMESGYRVVLVGGLPLSHYADGDRMGEAHSMVSLVEQGWAQQNEVARAFDCSERTVRRHQRRFDEGGLAALGRPSGYPRHRARLHAKRGALVNRWKGEGHSNREIARRLGVSEKAVRKLLRRLGWKPPAAQAEQLELALGDADPNLSASKVDTFKSPPQSGPSAAGSVARGADPNLSGSKGDTPESPPYTDLAPETMVPDADPNLAGTRTDEDQPPAVSFDADPSNREIDRLLASLGLLSDAAPLFRSATRVPNVGVLLAIPALVDSGVIDIARDVYGSIGPAFYGLRNTVVTLLLMALMRIKRPESLKGYSPEELGRLLGLDQAPEVKTLRRKLAKLAVHGRAAEFGRALAIRRVQSRGHAMGFLYVDGHVRAYHGKRDIPKAYVARRHLAMPATTDYWVNDVGGEPLFLVTCEANKQLSTMLPIVLNEVRAVVGERQITVVFDRGGWSPKLFQELIGDGFDILTYRKGVSRRVPKKHFSVHEGTIDERKLRYVLADREIRLLQGKLRLRQVTRLADDGHHQVGIVTSRQDLSALEVAYRISERWRQENFFKYLRTEYALDALVDYGVEAADSNRMIPNPERRALGAKLRKEYAELNQLTANYGVQALRNLESVRRTMRGFKIANAPLANIIVKQMKRIVAMETRLSKMPTRTPVQQVVDGPVIKLAVERKHLTDLLKMVAYQAECDLFRLLAPHYRRAEDESRALIRSALSSAGNIELSDAELRMSIDPLSSPHRTKLLATLCEHLNATHTRFPGTKLTLRFEVNPEPPVSLAFPGSRSCT